MPVLALGALITGAVAVGVTAATAGLAAVTLSTFAVPAAVTLGVGLISRALAPKPPSPATFSAPSFDAPVYASPMQTATQRISAVASVREVGVRGTAAQSINSAIAPARWIVGTVRTVGRTIWAMVYDDDVQMPDTTVPGEWGQTVLYGRDDKTVRNAVIYRSLRDNNLGNDPDGEAADPDEWAENTKYGEHVQVLFEGKVYASKGGENADEPPPNNMFWVFVANVEDLATSWAKVESVEEATKADTVSSLYLAQVISEDACEGIEEIWLDGEKLSVKKSTQNNHSVYSAPGFLCHEYFKADGTEGSECFAAAAAGSSELSWSASSVSAEGLSWVYIKLTQNDYGRDYDSRRYSGIPTIEFVVKGIKISAGRDPSGAKVYTENAAIIRKWWMTERRGIDFNRINKTYYRAAVSRCDTTIDISNLINFDSSAMQTDLVRYTINTLIHSGDDVTRIEQDMDFAFDGSIVEWDGEFLFRPGGDRASVQSIVGEDIVEEPIYRPGTTLNTNRYLCNMPQSEWHDYLAYGIVVDDVGRQDYDGSIQTLNLGSITMVSNPAQATNLLRSVARRARASSSLELVLMPGDDFGNSLIVPGDKVTVNIPEIAINDQDFFVLDSKVLAGWAVKLNLTEWGSDWYDDSVSLEHYTPRQVIPIAGDGIPLPTNVNAIITAAQNEDGTYIWYALVSVDSNHIWQMNVRYKLIQDEVYQEAQTASSQLILVLNQAGKWEFEVRLASRDGRRSRPITVEADATFDINLPPDPVLARSTFENGFMRFVFTNLGQFVNGIEVAYTYANIGEAAPSTIADAAEFVAAEQLGQYPILPTTALTDERTVIDSFPDIGQFNLYARVKDIAGRYSGIVRLGLETLRLDAPGNVDVDELGDGTRAYTWTLAQSAHIAGVQIRYKKAGDYIPVPGPIENAPPTIIAANVTADGDVVLAYSEPLDVDSVPAKSRYTVSADGTDQRPSTVTVDSNTVTLELTTKITVGQTVTVDYRVPTNNKLQDTHDEAAAALTDYVVNNVLRDTANQPTWISMEPLNEGYLTSSPYYAKIPSAGIWDFAFRSISVNGHLSEAITYLQVSLGEPVQLDIAEAVKKAIADNPALITLTGEVAAAEAARDRAIKAAQEGEAFKDSSEAFKNAAETAKAAAELAEAATETALTATKSARDAASGFADDAEAEALKAADSAKAAAGSATAAAGSATTSSNQATASERSATASAGSATASAASATAAGRSATASAASASTASTKASEASTEAESARTERVKAEAAKSDSEDAKDAAESAKAAAESAETAAVSAKQDAESAESAATTQASNAASSATASGRSATASANSASTAATKATEASQSASAAQTAKNAAETAQSKAETAESNAASSATDADGSSKAAASSASGVKANADAAKAAKDDAETAKDDAESAKDDAETAETNASNSATAAASSASTAKAEADKAGTRSSAAQSAQTAAETAQSKAETAETNAASSASAADGSADAAAASESAVAASAAAAKSSADAAATSSQTATTKASEASTSAAAAETAKTAAETAQANAGTSETNAATSETNADGSATAAATSATAAAASATTASDSATASAASATTAAAKATEVGTFASAAEAAQLAAETAEANAKVSETNAAAAQTTADGFAAAAQLSSEAAAGFSTTAQQAVAGLTATVSAEIDKNLKVTFASIIAMRAVAGDTQAKLELVALSDPSGSRAAGVMTGDFQSFDFTKEVDQDSKAASVTWQGMNFTHRVKGTYGNGVKIEIAQSTNAIKDVRAFFTYSSTEQRHVNLIWFRAPNNSGNQQFAVNDIIKATETKISGTLHDSYEYFGSGSGSVTINFDNKSGARTLVESLTLEGGTESKVSTKGDGWQFKRDGTIEVEGASIRGTIDAKNVSSDVNNWRPLLAQRPFGVGISAGRDSRNDPWTLFENKIIRLKIPDEVKMLATFYSGDLAIGTNLNLRNSPQMQISYIDLNSIPKVTSIPQIRQFTSGGVIYYYNFVPSLNTGQFGAGSAGISRWRPYAIFDPDRLENWGSTTTISMPVAVFLTTTRELIIGMTFGSNASPGWSYADTPNIYGIVTPEF